MTTKQKAKRLIVILIVAVLLYIGYDKVYVSDVTPKADSTSISVVVDTIQQDSTVIDTTK